MEKNRFLSQFTIALGSIFWHRKIRNTRSDLEKHNNILEAYELTIVLYKLIMNISYRQTYFYYFCNSVLSFKGSFIKKGFIWLLDYHIASCGGSVWFSQKKQSSSFLETDVKFTWSSWQRFSVLELRVGFQSRTDLSSELVHRLPWESEATLRTRSSWPVILASSFAWNKQYSKKVPKWKLKEDPLNRKY